GADALDGLGPAVLVADAELRPDEPDLGAHDARQQDVAHLVVDRVGPVDPALLDEDGLHAEPGRGRRDLPGVVGLHAADGHQRVGALAEGVGDQVLQLAGLVAAEGQAAVAVFALGPDLRAAEVGGEAFQWVHGAGAEGQRVTLEVVDGHAWLLTRATCNILHSTLDPLSRPLALTGPRDAGRAACGRAGPASAARWRRGSSPSPR